MKKYPEIDYSQRPASYWADENTLAAILRDVKGTERRNLIQRYWSEGRLNELPEELLKSTLSDEARESLGRIHPVCMGGEYLPDYRAGETEIARLELESTTADVISIRARCTRGRICFRIVDEYGTEFELGRKSSKDPLTLEELVQFIDQSAHPDLSGSLALCYNEVNAGGYGERDSLRDFTTIRSELYPQLEEHYDRVFEEWVEEGTA